MYAPLNHFFGEVRKFSAVGPETRYDEMKYLRLGQVPSTNTVRHIKCGLKLASALAQAPDWLLVKCVDDGECTGRVLALYDAAHMALSLKLQCLRTLDALLSRPYAVDDLLRRPLATPATADGSPVTGYGRLVGLLAGAQPTRAKVSLAALIRKLHVYDALQRVADTVRRLARRQSTAIDQADVRKLCFFR